MLDIDNKEWHRFTPKTCLNVWLEDLLANPRKIQFLIKEDLIQLKEKYDDGRRTEIIEEEIVDLMQACSLWLQELNEPWLIDEVVDFEASLCDRLMELTMPVVRQLGCFGRQLELFA